MHVLRRHPRLVALTAAGLALLVAGVVLAVLGYERSAGPAGAVRAYYAALADGDAPAALAWGDVPAGDRDLLTSAVLREQLRLAPIRDVDVGPARRDGSRASVPVTYRLAFASGVRVVRDTVTVVERDGDWRLTHVAGVTSLVLESASQRARILRHALPHGTVLLFPGAAPVTFDSPFLRADVRVPWASTDALTLIPQVTPAGRLQAVAAVTSALRGCVRHDPPAGCPLPGERYVPGSLDGTLGRAQLDVSVGSDDTGVLRVNGSVAFTGRYSTLDFVNRAHPGTGTVGLDVQAELYAVAPLRVRWVSP